MSLEVLLRANRSKKNIFFVIPTLFSMFFSSIYLFVWKWISFSMEKNSMKKKEYLFCSCIITPRCDWTLPPDILYMSKAVFRVATPRHATPRHCRVRQKPPALRIIMNQRGDPSSQIIYPPFLTHFTLSFAYYVSSHICYQVSEYLIANSNLQILGRYILVK